MLPGLGVICVLRSLGHILGSLGRRRGWLDLGRAQQQVLSHLCKDLCVWAHAWLGTLHANQECMSSLTTLLPPLLHQTIKCVRFHCLRAQQASRTRLDASVMARNHGLKHASTIINACHSWQDKAHQGTLHVAAAEGVLGLVRLGRWPVILLALLRLPVWRRWHLCLQRITGHHVGCPITQYRSLFAALVCSPLRVDRCLAMPASIFCLLAVPQPLTLCKGKNQEGERTFCGTC